MEPSSPTRPSRHLSRGMTFVSLGAAVALFFLPVEGSKFWNLDYQLFLAAMLAVPVLLVPRKGRWLRGVVLLLALFWFGFMQAACPRPVGAIELMVESALKGRSVWMYAIKLGVLGITGILFARFYCGWICPKGIIQEYVYQPRLGIRVPRKLDRVLKWGKYLMLVALVLVPLLFQFRLFKEIGPFRVIFNASYLDGLDGPVALMAFLGFVLLVSVFIERAFCRYFCPVGGLLGLLALLSPNRMRIDGSLCTVCGRCERECPVDAISTNEDRVVSIDAMECLTCRECESACRHDAIRFGMK